VKTPEANSAGGVDLHLSTVQELHVAAAIATQVRRGSHKQVNVYDRKTGETIKRVPIDDVLIGIAKVSDLTFSVRVRRVGWEVSEGGEAAQKSVRAMSCRHTKR
jgi:hypothetical protein